MSVLRALWVPARLTLLQEIEKTYPTTNLFGSVCVIEEPVAAFCDYKEQFNPLYLNYTHPEEEHGHGSIAHYSLCDQSF